MTDSVLTLQDFARLFGTTADNISADCRAIIPNAIDIIRAVEGKLGLSPTDLEGEEFSSHEGRFKEPFQAYRHH
jgi:hypothetical protein